MDDQQQSQQLAASIQELVSEIELNEAILHSLDEADTATSPGDRELVMGVLDTLRGQLRRLQSIPSWGNSELIEDEEDQISTEPHTPSYDETVSEASMHPSGSLVSSGPVFKSQYNSPTTTPKAARFSDYTDANSPFLTLPNRSGGKRPFDGNDEATREIKSRRTTPSPAITAPTTPSSTTDSFDYDFGDDPILQQLLGTDLKEEMKDSRRYQKELERKKVQEQADEEFARSLQESWNQPQSFGLKASDTYQAVFDPQTGALRSMPPPPRPVIKSEQAVKSERGYLSMPGPSNPSHERFLARDMPSPVSLSDSDSDIEEISAREFTPRRLGPNRMMAQSSTMYPSYPSTQISGHSMPGAFPTAPYMPLGGSSVYMPTLSTDSHLPIPSSYGVTLAPGISPLSSFDPTAHLSSMRDYRDSLYSDPSKTEEEIKELLQHIRPDEDLDANSREGTPLQLKATLMEHQKLGLAWMKKMEEGSNKGGILADDMGLGKTLQALALIVSRPAIDRSRKTTLIVAPVALLQQWKREIERHVRTRYRLTVLILHGEARNTTWSTLRTYDVVLTTYGLIASELKRKLKWDEKVKMHPNIRPSGKEDFHPVLGDTSKWYRVILDESQAIKNKSTKAAIGASLINSEYRWCMSGTPMQNNVTELYSLIHFLRIKPYNESEKFSKDFTRPLKGNYDEAKRRAMRQLQALLKAILLRRTKTSKIDGKPILQLPPKTTQEQRAVFSEDEREFYKALESKTQLTFNRYLKAGTVGRNYSNILVLLLRLRQACCHPHLIKDFAINTGGPAGVDMIANARDLPADVIERLKQTDAFECPICMDAVLNPIIFNPCGHFVCEECLAKWSDQALANGDDGVANLTCPHCRSKIDMNKVTDHTSFRRVFCQGEEGVEPVESGFDEEDETASDTDSEIDSDDSDDSDDGKDLKDFIVPDDVVEYDSKWEEENDYFPGKSPFEKSKKEPVKDEEADGGPMDGRRKSNDKKGKRRREKEKGKRKAPKDDHKSLAQLRKEGLRNKAAKKKYLRRLEKDWQTSAKIEKTIALLESIHARGQNEKTIIFSGFTSFLDLLEVPISRSRELGAYTRYDGSMSATERNDAVLDFTDRPECTMMLVSLKAGNSGLNLTAASQVVILDPHWNGYVEAQAIDRAYRIGQMRPVEVHRVLIDGEGLDPDQNGNSTVEDRILALQEKKRELVESALDETAGKNISRLGARELGFLFVSLFLVCNAWR